VGLAGIYRCFIKNFEKPATPLTSLLNVTPAEFNEVQNDPKQWKQVTSVIDIIKAGMLANPALALPSKEGGQYIVQTDASDFAIGATLQQLQTKENTGEWMNKIIAYFSHKLHSAETRCWTYHKGPLGVKDVIEHWRFYLHGDKFKVQTDHLALQHNLKPPRLTNRQLRLLETLMEYDFEIEYLPGAWN
jgi:putative transposase